MVRVWPAPEPLVMTTWSPVSVAAGERRAGGGERRGRGGCRGAGQAARHHRLQRHQQVALGGVVEHRADPHRCAVVDPPRRRG